MTGVPSIPAPPSFDDFKFKVIGQQPQLLKRISMPAIESHYPALPSPSPPLSVDLQYPSPLSSPKILSRPSLLQVLTNDGISSDTIMSDVRDEMVADTQQTPLLQMETFPDYLHPPVPPLGRAEKISGDSSPPRQVDQSPTQSTILQAVTPDLSTKHPEDAATPVIHLVKAAPSSKNCEHDFSYTTLHALHARLLSSLAELKPPDATEALLLVQSASTRSATALSTACRSYTFAQQSLISAQEAVAAAQECLGAAEQAKTHADDAAAVVDKFINETGAIGGKAQWECRTVINGLQKDIHSLGEWIREREGEETTRRRQADTAEREYQNKALVEAAMSWVESGRPYPCSESTMEDAQPLIENRHPSLTTGNNCEYQRSAEIEADDARRAWSLEKGCSRSPSMAFPEVQEHDDQIIQEQSDFRPVIQAERSHRGLRGQEEEDRLLHASQQQADIETMANRMRELEKQKLEVARFQTLEREQKERRQAEELSKREAEALRLLVEVDGLRKGRAEKAKVVTKRTLEVNRATAIEKEKLQEQRQPEELQRRRNLEEETEKVETARLLEHRNRHTDLQMKHFEAEKGANVTTEPIQADLLTEQERRQVVVQKQCTSAETAAKILTDAREKRLYDNTDPLILPDPHVYVSHSLPHPQQYGNHEAKKTVIAPMPGPTKPRSFSGDPQVDPTLGEHQHPADSPSSSSMPVPSIASNSQPAPTPFRERSSASPDCTTVGAGKKHDNNLSIREEIGRNISTGNTSSSSITPHRKPTSLPNVTALNSVLNVPSPTHLHGHYQAPGNAAVILAPHRQPTSPQTSVADFRFVRDTNDILRDTYLKGNPDSNAVNPKTRADNIVKVEDDDTTSLPVPIITSRVEAELRPPVISSPIVNSASTSAKSTPTSMSNNLVKPRLSKVRTQDETEATSAQLSRTTPPTTNTLTMGVHTDPTTLVVSSKAVSSDSLVNPSLVVGCSQQQDEGTRNGQRSVTRSDSYHETTLAITVPELPATRSIQTSHPATHVFQSNDLNSYEGSHITSAIHRDSGSDKVSNNTSRKFLRDHYSSKGHIGLIGHHSSPLSSPQDNKIPNGPHQVQSVMSMVHTPSLECPLVLGKRRYREDPRLDEPPAHRHWHMENDYERKDSMPHSARTRPTGSKWRSPSPARHEPLQSRIGTRDPAVYKIGGGESYRPTYAPESYGETQSHQIRGRQIAQHTEHLTYAAQSDGYKSRGRHDSPSDRAIRGKGSSISRGSTRVRDSRGGRPLEQRISYHTNALTLMDRLASPPRTYS